MSVLRFVATLCLLIALIALVADFTPTVAGARSFSLSSIEDHWKQVAPATFQSMEESVTGGRAGWVWTFIVGPLVAVPTAIMFAILAGLAGYIGRRRTRVKIYSN
ncbi:MAG: hypothetical protein K0U34_07140 [Alphaproteobacteria bacterium]|nr:hypothetical protein [Alphaproteobacteria bacterium]